MIASSIQNSQSLPLNCEIYIGPNCNIEYRSEGREVSALIFAELAFLYYLVVVVVVVSFAVVSDASWLPLQTSRESPTRRN